MATLKTDLDLMFGVAEIEIDARDVAATWLRRRKLATLWAFRTIFATNLHE